MGKRLIIKGADFSANAIPFNQEERIVAALSKGFYVRKGLLENGSTISDPSRCVISAADISNLLSEGSKLKIKVKDEFDFVFGIGNGSTITYYQAGDSIVGTFAWITDGMAKAPISSSQKLIYLNFRYKGTYRTFDLDTTLDDLIDVTSIE